MSDKSPSEQIDDIIKMHDDWRGKTLAQLRAIILDAHPDITEEVKWKKPSKPEGVSVWYANGNICIGEVLKNAVRLTFPKGAQISDPEHLFNTRLDSKTVRAIDFSKSNKFSIAGLQSLILEAINLNI